LQEFVMGSFSIWHWLIVLVVVVLIFGTKKLKNVGADLGAAVKGFKDGVKDGTGSADAAEAPAAPPQQVTARKAADANTVDVEAKTKS
jgi:sec-independent protein translocase protein TatA